jgi:hypothetical protein
MRFLWRKLFISSNPPNPYFISNFLIKIKLVFDRIKSCPVWKFILNQNRHCCSRARPSSFPRTGPRSHARPTCATHSPASAWHRTPPDQRPSSPLPRSYQDAGPRSPPASVWRRLHRTPSSSPYTHGRAGSSSLSFSPALALKPPRAPLSSPLVRARCPARVPPPLLWPPMTSLAIAGHRGPFSTPESRRSTVAPPSSVSSTLRVVLLHLARA